MRGKRAWLWSAALVTFLGVARAEERSVAVPADGGANCERCETGRRGRRADGERPVRAVLGRLNPFGWGCYATHNSLGCGSLHAEWTFLFGSCRAFYGEPCVKPAHPGRAR